jgi:hypothetical protein
MFRLSMIDQSIYGCVLREQLRVPCGGTPGQSAWVSVSAAGGKFNACSWSPPVFPVTVRAEIMVTLVVLPAGLPRKKANPANEVRKIPSTALSFKTFPGVSPRPFQGARPAFLEHVLQHLLSEGVLKTHISILVIRANGKEDLHFAGFFSDNRRRAIRP